MTIASFIVSLLALTGSLGIGIRQIQMSRGASHLKLSMDFLDRYFEGGFADSETFVHTELSQFDDGERTISTLPEVARLHALKVAGLYQMLGHLSACKAIDGDMLPIYTWCQCSEIMESASSVYSAWAQRGSR